MLRALQERWSAEAGRNQVFPLVDELIGRIAAVVPWPNPVPTRAVYRPEGGPVPDDSVARLFGGFRLAAEVDVPDADAAGVLAAMGDWTGGFAFFVRDGRLVFVLNRAGDEGRVESDVPTYRPVGTSSRACTRPASQDPVSACITTTN